MTLRAEQLKVQLLGLEQQPPSENRKRRIGEIEAELAKEDDLDARAPKPAALEAAVVEAPEQAVQSKARGRKAE